MAVSYSPNSDPSGPAIRCSSSWMIRSGRSTGQTLSGGRCGQVAALGVGVGFVVVAHDVEVRGAEAVAGALAGHPSEEGGGGALPRELSELVGGGDDQVGQEPVDLLVDADHGDALPVRLLGGERAPALGIAAGDERPP